MEQTFSWSREEAVNLCIIVEAIAPQFNCHVALTGGTLYKTGNRKDCDILFYRVRQKSGIDMAGLIKGLELVGVKVTKGSRWCYKAVFQGKSVDLFFPEEQSGNVIGEGGTDYL